MPFITELDVCFIGSSAHMRLNSPLVYHCDEYGRIEVPRLFVSDGGSVPNGVLLRGIVQPHGVGRRGFVLHDWLYSGGEKNRFNRLEADNIMRAAHIDDHMPAWRAAVAYRGVRVGGALAWHRKRAGLVTAEERRGGDL